MFDQNAAHRGGFARAVRVACLVVALVIGAAVTATFAKADPPYDLSLTTPAVVGNSGAAGAGFGHVTVTNGDTPSTTATVQLNIIPTPSSIKAADLTIGGLPAGDTARTVDDGDDLITATITLGTLPAGGPTTIPFTVAVDTGAAATNGTLLTYASLYATAASDEADAEVDDGQTIRVVSGPLAPTLNAPLPATIYQNYSATVLAPGSPTAAVRVYDNQPTSGATGTTAVAVTPITGATGHKLFTLNDQLVFDATAGTLTGQAGHLQATDARPESFTIVANNGVGGATTAAPGAPGTPARVLHDVSQTIAVPVLFSDVPLVSTFGAAIYSLAQDRTISGYDDGTFRSSATVSRDAFVKFAAGVLDAAGFYAPTGTCDATHRSAFPDVRATSPFCREITELSQDGIVNGYRDGTFRPGAPVTRGAATAVLYRVDLSLRNLNPKFFGDAKCSSPIPFTDVTTKNVFCGDIEWAAKNGITQGFVDGGFHPAAGASRGESAQFVYKLKALEKLV